MTRSLTVVGEFVAPGAGPAGLAWDGETLWNADFRDGRIYGLDGQDGAVRKSLYCPGNLSGLTWDGRALWQSLFDQEMIRRVNPATNDFDETIILSGQGWVSGVAWDGQILWVVAQQFGRLLAIDPLSKELQAKLATLMAMGDIDYHNGFLWASVATPMVYDQESGRFDWASDTPEYAVVQIDPRDGQVVTRHPVEALYSGLCWAGEVLYMAHTASRKIVIASIH